MGRLRKIYDEILTEDKRKLIERLPNLSPNQKQKLIEIFKRRNQLEKNIDWNNKNLKWNDFYDVVKHDEYQEGSKIDNLKIASHAIIWKDYDKGSFIVEVKDKEFAEQVSRSGAKFAPSVPKDLQTDKISRHGYNYHWCTGTGRFDEYKKQGYRFYFMYLPKKEGNKKFMIYGNSPEQIEISGQNDESVYKATNVFNLNLFISGMYGVNFEFKDSHFDK